MRVHLWLILLGLLLPGVGYAKRSSVIDFEDDVIEGVNRLPLDSLSQLSDKNRLRKRYLYLKRKGFSTELRETQAWMEEQL
jgi:hypothetical protein